MRVPVLAGKKIFAAILGFSLLAGAAAAASQSVSTARTQANVMVEITFTASQDYRDAFHEVTLDAVFETPQGRTLKVPAFWAGGRTWKVRYASPAVGTHRWRSVCSVPADQGLHGLTGTVTVGELPWGEPPLSPRSRARCRRPAAFRASGRHAVFLAGRYVVDGPLPAAPLAGGVPATGRRPEGQRIQRGPDRGRAVPRHAGLRPPRGQRGGLPLGKELRPHSARVLRPGRPAASSTWSIRDSCPASSAPGDTIFPGWARSG